MQWLTGWPFARFLVFHRWIARIVFTMLLVHVGSKTITIKKIWFLSWILISKLYDMGYCCNGCMWVINWSFMANIQKYKLRSVLIVHHVLVIIFIAGGWIHSPGNNLYITYCAAVAVWGFDKLIRLVRVTSYGVKKANVELIANEVLKVTIPRPQWWRPFPGSYAYIYFLKPAFCWQSHPFTLVDSVQENNTLTFYIKVKGGMTHGIYKQLLCTPSQCATFNVLLKVHMQVHTRVESLTI